MKAVQRSVRYSLAHGLQYTQDHSKSYLIMGMCSRSISYLYKKTKQSSLIPQQWRIHRPMPYWRGSIKSLVTCNIPTTCKSIRALLYVPGIKVVIFLRMCSHYSPKERIHSFKLNEWHWVHLHFRTSGNVRFFCSFSLLFI